MSKLYETINRLCETKGESITQMCLDSKVARASLTDLKMDRKKTLSTQSLGKIASHFLVSVDYLLGLSDKYGLTSDDWKNMGEIYKNARLNAACSKESAVDGQALTADELSAFEDGGVPLTPAQLTVACGLIGEDPTDVFSQWSENLWGEKNKPTDDGELAKRLQILRDDFSTRMLLDAYKDMTPDEVERMAQFGMFLKGGGKKGE